MFILASKSPRRAELLKQLGCEFRTEPTETEEISGEGLPPVKIAVANAKLKAEAAFKTSGGLPTVGADTIVTLDGHIHYKPKDTADAKNMLRTLAGRTHEVITGIAVVKDNRTFTASDSTKVTFDEMTDEEIDAYVSTGEPMDKSGSYALQGKAGIFIRGIEGSYSNVVGLPLATLKKLAAQAGVKMFFTEG